MMVSLTVTFQTKVVISATISSGSVSMPLLFTELKSTPSGLPETSAVMA